MTSKNVHREMMVKFLIAIVLTVGTLIFMQGCKHESGAKSLKDGVIGDWEEIHGTQEMLTFGSDGMLEMKRPGEHRNCHYDFPDDQHIRMDCAVPGVPSHPQSWKIAVTADTLKVSDELETGTYRRREESSGSDQPQSGH